MPGSSERRPGDKTGLAAVGGVALAVACCAGGPLLAATVGSLAVGALLGIAAGIALLVAAGTTLWLRRRSRADKPGIRS